MVRALESEYPLSARIPALDINASNGRREPAWRPELRWPVLCGRSGAYSECKTGSGRTFRVVEISAARRLSGGKTRRCAEAAKEVSVEEEACAIEVCQMTIEQEEHPACEVSA